MTLIEARWYGRLLVLALRGAPVAQATPGGLRQPLHGSRHRMLAMPRHAVYTAGRLSPFTRHARVTRPKIEQNSSGVNLAQARIPGARRPLEQRDADTERPVRRHGQPRGVQRGAMARPLEQAIRRSGYLYQGLCGTLRRCRACDGLPATARIEYNQLFVW